MFEPLALTTTGTLMHREPAAPLERSFAAFDEAPDVPAALSSEEHRRLTHYMEALLEQVASSRTSLRTIGRLQTGSTGTPYFGMIGSRVAMRRPCSSACATMTRSNGSR